MEVAVQPIETLVVVDDRERLAHALRLARGFALFFVRCNVPAYRAELVAHLKAQLARPVVEVDLEGEPDVYPAVARAAGSSAEDAVLFVYGLEHHLPSGDPERAQQTLRALNWRRAAYQRLGWPLAFWLPEYALAMVAREAPDFYDWNSGVFEIEVPQPQREALLADALALPDEAEASLPVEEKRARLRLLEGLWEEYRGESLAERQARLQVALKMARLHESLGDYNQARRLYEESLHIAEELGDRAGVARVLHNLGVLAQQQGDYGRAWQFYEESLRISEELGDRAGVARVLHNLGVLAQQQGDYGRAWQFYEESLRIEEELGDRAGVAQTLHNLGVLAQDTGEYSRARHLYQESLRIAEELGDRAGVATTLHQLGMLAQDTGDYGQARQFYQESLRIKEELGNRAGVAITTAQLALLEEAEENLERALELITRAEELFAGLGSPYRELARRVRERIQRTPALESALEEHHSARLDPE
jgi:tetratricopeptide (TPR) repeat protein